MAIGRQPIDLAGPLVGSQWAIVRLADVRAREVAASVTAALELQAVEAA
jgi:hypothetical protein